MTAEDPMSRVNVECRKTGCEARTERPVSLRDGIDWIESHGREAHDNPYLGARWTSVREPRGAEPEHELEAGN